MKFEYCFSIRFNAFQYQKYILLSLGNTVTACNFAKNNNLPMEPSSKEGEIKIEFCIDFAYVFNFDQFRVLGEYNNTLHFFNYNLAVSHRN